MRRVTRLLDIIRIEADNEDSSDVADNTIIEFLNRGQEHITSIVTTLDETFLSKESYINVVAGTRDYSLPTDMLLDNKVVSVSRTNQTSPQVEQRLYYLVRQIMPSQDTGQIGYYIQRNTLSLSPVPSDNVGSGLRINYIKKPLRLDKRRGTISSLAPLTITGFDTNETLPSDELTIVDSSGTIIVDNIINSGFDSGTGVITTTTDVSSASVGQFVLLGPNATTHSELPDQLEKYLIEFANLKLFHKDSSADVAVQSQLLLQMEERIRDMYASNNMDAEYVQILNSEYLDY